MTAQRTIYGVLVCYSDNTPNLEDIMNFEVDMEGFDEIQDRLEEMKEGAQELEGEHAASFGELFPDRFMRRYTDFSDIEEMVAESPFSVETREDFEEIPEDEWDEFVAERTRFDSWESMMGKAWEQYSLDKLGF